MLAMNYQERFYAREMLRDSLRNMAVHGENDIAVKAAERALVSLDAVDVVDACLVNDLLKIRVQDAFIVAIRAGVFDVRF